VILKQRSIGDDLLIGNAGNDILIGDLGSDIFAITGKGFGDDVIADYTIGEDILDLGGASVLETQVIDGDLVLTLEEGTVTLRNISSFDNLTIV